jgi:hypothetical protein
MVLAYSLLEVGYMQMGRNFLCVPFDHLGIRISAFNMQYIVAFLDGGQLVLRVSGWCQGSSL